MTLQERIAANVEMIPEAGCWIWMGAVDENDYGRINVHGKNRRAHRISYESYVGPIPAGLDLDHLCRTPSCVNPDHLEPVTRQINVLRGLLPDLNRVPRVECRRGHVYEEVGFYRRKKNGHRMCKACVRRLRSAGGVS